MKKSLVKTTILAIILVAAILGTTVNAGSVTAPETKEAGKEVTVDIALNSAAEYNDTVLEFNNKQLTYKSVAISEGSGSVDAGIISTSGDTTTLKVSAASSGSTITKVSVTFTIAEGATGNIEVKVISNENNTNEALTNSTVTVKVAEETKDPEKDPEKDPSKDPEKDPDKKPTNPSGDKVGTDGKPITKLPQTGAPIFAGAIALVVLTAGAIVLVKRAK